MLRAARRIPHASNCVRACTGWLLLINRYAAISDEIDESERRLRALLDAARAHPDTPLAEGTWTVRDTLCHVAARANDVPLVLQLVDRRPDLDAAAAESEAINAGQIANRARRSVDELADEAMAGYAAARDHVRKLDPEFLDQTNPDVAGQGPMSVADLLLLVYRSHAQAHLASIEQALERRRE
jgi:DinB superfamily